MFLKHIKGKSSSAGKLLCCSWYLWALLNWWSVKHWLQVLFQPCSCWPRAAPASPRWRQTARASCYGCCSGSPWWTACSTPHRRLLRLPGGNIRLKLLHTFWFRFVMRLLLLLRLRFAWLLFLLLPVIWLLMLTTNVMTEATVLVLVWGACRGSNVRRLLALLAWLETAVRHRLCQTFSQFTILLCFNRESFHYIACKLSC